MYGIAEEKLGDAAGDKGACLEQALLEVRALVARGIAQLLLGDDVEHGEADGGGQRLVEMGGEEEEALAIRLLLDRRGGRRRRPRNAPAQRLRDGQEIRRDPLLGAPPHVARAAGTGLRLIQD